MSLTILSGGTPRAAYSDNQRIGLAHCACILKAAQRHGGELTSAIEACARTAKRHDVEAADGMDMVLAFLEPHQARASLVGAIFREVYAR
jgi:hypothetical protein